MAEPQTPPEPAAGRTDRNAAAVWRYAKAWAEGDLTGVIDAYDDDITLHYFGQNPFAGTHRGKQAALDVLARLQAKTNRQLVTVHDVTASNGHAVLLARERFEHEGSTVELERVLVYRMRGDRFAECWVYDQDQRLVDELLSDP